MRMETGTPTTRLVEFDGLLFELESEGVYKEVEFTKLTSTPLVPTATAQATEPAMEELSET